MKYILIFALILAGTLSYSQTTDQEEISFLKNQVDSLQNIVNDLNQEIESYMDHYMEYAESYAEEKTKELKKELALCRMMKPIPDSDTIVYRGNETQSDIRGLMKK